MQSAYAGTRMPVAAYMELARERGAEIVTPLAAEAMPSGPVQEDTYERMAGLVCDAVAGGLRRGPARPARRDGGRARARRGGRAAEAECADIAPDLPIAVTCDLHCNLTAAMVENCTALIGYKTYPQRRHVRGGRTGRPGGPRRRRRAGGPGGLLGPRSDVLSQTLCQGTDDEPMRSLIAMCREAEAREGVLAATTFGRVRARRHPGRRQLGGGGDRRRPASRRRDSRRSARPHLVRARGVRLPPPPHRGRPSTRRGHSKAGP